MCKAAERCVALGVFDGVHIGHREILRGVDTALTFSRHPLSVMAPDAAPDLIMPLEERIKAIRSCGVKEVEVIEFTEETAAISAEDFAKEHFASGKAGVVKVRCGGNWRFGRGGEGNAEFLRKRNICVEEVPYALFDGEVVSSSRIRKTLLEGDVESAAAMLGRSFFLKGEAFRGKGTGRKIGFPTINIRCGRAALRRGVYVASLDGRRAIANFGTAPSMGREAWREPVLEVHLTDAVDGVRHDGVLTVELHRFLRPEKKFGSIEELRRQIADDVAAAKCFPEMKGE